MNGRSFAATSLATLLIAPLLSVNARAVALIETPFESPLETAIAVTSEARVEARAQPQDRRPRRQGRQAAADDRQAEREAAIRRGVELLLAMQEGEAEGDDGPAEWPYQGVYRVNGQIPVGYRVGGTSICAMALMAAPGYESDADRKAAVRRAIGFVCRAADEPLMSIDEYEGGYDVRGWGYCYALQFLLAARAADAIPADLREESERRIRHYIDALQRIEIPSVGGWNYARSPGRDAPSPCSPFMSAPSLRALYEARAQGFDVDDAVVTRGLDALQHCRTASGAFAYASSGDARGSRDGTPGAVGRMVAAEVALELAGRSDTTRIRGAVDAFLAHWDELEKRRAQSGTHVPPFSVAPYYFFYAHLYAAEAIERLPAHERNYYRRRLEALLFKVRGEDGSWNDRVFPRSANFGTAASMLALTAPDRPAPARWTPAAPEVVRDGDQEGGATAGHTGGRATPGRNGAEDGAAPGTVTAPGSSLAPAPGAR